MLPQVHCRQDLAVSIVYCEEGFLGIARDTESLEGCDPPSFADPLQLATVALDRLCESQ